MQHEALEGFVFEKQVQPLHVFFGAQRQCRQRLRLAAREKCRTMHARQQSHFAGDRPNLIERSPIRPAMPVQHIVPEKFLSQPFKRPLRLFL